MQLLNISGTDKNRRIVEGNPTGIIQLNDVRYQWATKLYSRMRDDFWRPEKVSVVDDKVDLLNLTPEEYRAFKLILSYLTYLDSLQTNMIPHVLSLITAPEIRLCLNEQLSQEGMHNNSYQYLIETLIPEEERNQIYENWREVPELTRRVESITKHYQAFVDEPNNDNFIRAIFADYILEGIFFQNGFIFFYSLARRGKMPKCADMFKLINRDERNHVYLYQKIFLGLVDELSINEEQLQQDCLLMMREAVDAEVEWSNFAVGDQVLGIKSNLITAYTQYLADQKLSDANMPSLYDVTSSPFKHLEQTSFTEDQNFFESKVTTYRQAESIGDWDF